jgi:hypothetical protein
MQAKGRTRRSVALLVAIGFAALVLPPSAGGATTTFTNPAPITIPTSGDGSPYPSSVVASNLPGNITDVSVTLNGFSHDNPIEVGSALVGPGGHAMLLHFCMGGTSAASNVTFTISDSGGGQPPPTTPLTAGGIYRPTNNDCGVTNPSFPAPGPGTAFANPGPEGGSATLTGTLGGTDPNGTWNLFVRDFNAGSTGTISGGWSLTITTPDDTSPPNATITRGPKDKTRKRRATFEFTGTDARAIASFQCKLDAAAFVPCTSPYTVRVKKGKHRFQVQAIDQAGNVGSPATDTWKRKRKKNKK